MNYCHYHINITVLCLGNFLQVHDDADIKTDPYVASFITTYMTIQQPKLIYILPKWF